MAESKSLSQDRLELQALSQRKIMEVSESERLLKIIEDREVKSL